MGAASALVRGLLPAAEWGGRVTATAWSVELRSIAQEVADALPTEVEEVVVTALPEPVPTARRSS
jgi:hypothetical protein